MSRCTQTVGVCTAWMWVSHVVCKAWHTTVERVCIAWRWIVVAVCVGWCWIVRAVYAVFAWVAKSVGNDARSVAKVKVTYTWNGTSHTLSDP